MVDGMVVVVCLSYLCEGWTVDIMFVMVWWS